MRNAAFVAALLAVVGLAAALRLPALDIRPMHADEAVNAVLTKQLWQGEGYRFDPSGFHGPTLHYLTLPALWSSGAADFAATSESMFRIVPALIGLLSILALTLFADGIGRRGVIAAGLLTAVSPAMAFYHGYYIHETLLAFSTLVLIGASWRWSRSGHNGWAVLAGASAGFMFATKETSIVTWAAITCAWIAERLWSRSARCGGDRKNGGGGWLPPRCSPRGVLAAGITAVVVSVLFYSSFFTHWPGVVDSLRALAGQVDLATGEGPHRHPVGYYLGLLAYHHPRPGPTFSEAFVLVLGLAGFLATWRRWTDVGHGSLQRFLTLFTIAMTVAYSLIPYKTPWCLLQFYQPMLMVAGFGAASVLGRWQTHLGRIPAVVVLATLTVLLAVQAKRATVDYASDPRNPYVYAHPAGDISRLAGFITKLEQAPREGPWWIQVVARHPWPLPWVLRRHRDVGFWDTPPDRIAAPVVIAAPEFDERIARRLGDGYEGPFFYGLRPGSVISLYVRKDVWHGFSQ